MIANCQMVYRTHYLSLACAIAASLFCSQPQANTYRWTDAQGNVHYGDQIPADDMDRAYSVINQQGIVIQNVEQTKTKEQLQEEKRQQAIRDKEQQAAQARALHDHILLDTYSTEQDIIDTRDRNIAMLDGLINVSQHKLETLDRELQKLTRSAAEMERQGKPASSDLHQDIANTQSQIDGENVFIRNQRLQQAQIREKFAADLIRYRELKAAISAPN